MANPADGLSEYDVGDGPWKLGDRHLGDPDGVGTGGYHPKLGDPDTAPTTQTAM